MKTVIEMAKEAGFTEGELAWHDEILERLVELVRADERAQRKPLTDGELADLWYKQSLDWLEFGRAVQAAHGIGEKPDAA